MDPQGCSGWCTSAGTLTHNFVAGMYLGNVDGGGWVSTWHSPGTWLILMRSVMGGSGYVFFFLGTISPLFNSLGIVIGRVLNMM